MNYRDFELKFCASCLYTTSVAALLWGLGDPYMAVFFFCAMSILISGWKSKSQDCLIIAFAMFIAWVVNTLIFFSLDGIGALTSFNVSPDRVIYFVALFSHCIVAIMAFDRSHHWLAAITGLMGIVAFCGLITDQFMPWRAMGNVLFLFQTIFFVSLSIGHRLKLRQAPMEKPAGKNIVRLEVASGRTVAGVR